MSRRARTVRLESFGGPEVLQIGDVDLPEPGPGEVILDVEWIGLNRAEVLWREGEYLLRPEFPAPIGMECSGVVADIGAGVNRFSTGDRVGVVPAMFDARQFGTYGESIVIPARALLPTPAELQGPESAALWMAYLTTWGGLLDVGGLEKGWHVVIPAASSSVGIAAIQFSLLEEAHPIAVTTHPEKVEKLEELGAEHVIVSPAEDLSERVLEITDGKGAELFFDPVGGSLLAGELKCAAPGGKIVLYGLLDREPIALDARLVIGRGLRLEGYLLPATTRDPQVFDIAVQQVVEGVQSGDLQPVVSRVLPFDQIQEAHRYLESGEQIGKVVVEVK